MQPFFVKGFLPKPPEKMEKKIFSFSDPHFGISKPPPDKFLDSFTKFFTVSSSKIYKLEKTL